MKTFRIIVADASKYPFEIQIKNKKYWWWPARWRELKSYSNQQDAEDSFPDIVRGYLDTPEIGRIIKIYEESDHIIDKLKGKM